MRLFLLLSVMLARHHTDASEAFLLIDAMVVPSELKQPTWIAVRGNGRQQHLPAGDSIVAIEPGVYRVEHIDFQKFRGSGVGTVFVEKRSDEFSVEVAPNAITYVGIIVLEAGKGRRKENQYTTVLQSGPKLLSWACHKNPEPFSRLPVRYLNADGELEVVKVRCEARQNGMSDS